MKSNRSIPAATVIPVLVYPDVRAAVEWLNTCFGFIERVRIGEAHRAQLSVGVDGAVIVADVHGEQQPPHPRQVPNSSPKTLADGHSRSFSRLSAAPPRRLACMRDQS
jgi:uncharacterized glyoxalase superfamily protein PhnB